MPESYIQNLVIMAKWFLRKASFNFDMQNNVGPRPRNDLDLAYSHI